jgi:hypothetical protein
VAQDELGGYYHPTGTGTFVGCGSSPTAKMIYYWKINSDGTPLFSRNYWITQDTASSTRCKGVYYDNSKGLGAMLVVSPASAIKAVNTYPADATVGA